MIDPTRALHAPALSRVPRQLQRLAFLFVSLLVCLFKTPGAAGQPPQQEYPANYHEPFKGKPQHAEDFTLLGADAGACVKFEPEGLRITLPAGKQRSSTGVATAFGATGDFEITLGYEILQEPEPADAGSEGGTRISLTVNLNRPGTNLVAMRRRVITTQEPRLLTWQSLRNKADGKSVDIGKSFPVKAKTGRFRLVRTGADLAYYVSEGADKEFTLLRRFPLGTDDVRDVQIFASSTSDTAFLDARFTDLRISAASLPRKPALPKKAIVSEPTIPDKDYAQTYSQSFRGSGTRPEGWNFVNRLSEQCVQFEPGGLHITLPPGGPEKGQAAGIVSAFGVKGDFEITLSFESLKDPRPADVGKAGTRFSLAVTLNTPQLDTPQSETATLNRSMANKGFSTWMRNRDRPAAGPDTFRIPAMSGRLRLVRSGDELFYLASVGVDQPFTFLKKYRFGAEDLQRVGISGSTGGDKAFLDVRVTDLRIRADGIPDAPAPDTARDTQQPVPAPKQGSKVWLAAGLLLMLTLVAVFALGFLLRKRAAKEED